MASSIQDILDQTGGGSSDGYQGAIESVLASAPGLSTASPGLVLDAANAGADSSRAAIVLHQGANLQAGQDAVADEESDGGGGKGVLHWLAGVGGHVADALNKIPGEEGVENAGGKVLNALSKPLGEVADDYAYLHKVWADHGPIAGFLATLGVAGGAALGSLIGQPVIGGELVAAGERQLAKHGVFGDGYKQTAIDAETAKISPGRDLASGLGQIPGLHTLQNTDEGFGKYLSGGVDLAAMFATDPIAKGLRFKSEIHSGDAALKARNTAFGAFLADHAPGYRITTGDSVDALRDSALQGGGYRRAIQELAGMNSADIVARYPQYESIAGDYISAGQAEKFLRLPDGAMAKPDGELIYKGLGSAKTDDEVHDVFRNLAEDADFQGRLTNMATLPSKSITRVPFSAAAERLRNVDSEGAVADQRNLILPKKVGPASLRGADKTPGLEAPALSSPLNVAKSLLPGEMGTEARSRITGAVAKKVRTFSGYMPFALDKTTLALSTKKFTADSPLAPVGVYRTFRYSMGEQRARYWTDRFINAKSEAERTKVWAEGNVEMYKAAGLPDDNYLVLNLRQKLHDLSDAPMTEPKSVYGVGAEKGTDVSRVQLADRTDSAALWGDQVGQYYFPNFMEMKRSMREAQGFVKNSAGKVDDFVADYFTNAWFKPLALLTAGFGLRVAMAEAIPAAMRYGALNMLRGEVASQAAKRNWRLEEGEDGHVLAATSRVFGGMQNMLRVSPEDRELAMDLVKDGNGHYVMGVGHAGDEGGHGYLLPDDVNEKARALAYYTRSEMSRNPQVMGKLDNNFDTISRDNPIYDEEWLNRLQHLSQQVPARMMLRDMINGVDKDTVIADEAARIRAAAFGESGAHEPYLYEAKRMKRYDYVKDEGYQPEVFAHDRYDALRGALTGEDGTFHSALAEKIAAGEKPTVEDLAAIGKEQRPVQVYGPLRMPYIGPNPLQRVIQGGFKKFIDPIINNISREPIFFNAVKQEMRSLDHLVESGTLDRETALRIAKTRGVVSMLPQIHNTALRSQFAQLARNFLPFYFAQEQAVKRAGYLAAMHPEALREYELLHHAMNEPGFVHGDNEHGRYLIFPVVGALGKGALYGLGGLGVNVETGLPVNVAGNMSSLKTVLPEFQAPGVSPLAAISLNTLANIFPELRRPVHATLGDVSYGQGAVDALIPNTLLRNLFKAAHPDENDRSYGNALLGAVAQAYYEGKMPGPGASAQEKQAFMDRMKNNTRSGYMVKAFLGLVSPLAPSVTTEDPKFREEFQNLVQKHGYVDALNLFLKEHGDSAVSFTVARSEPTTPGAHVPYTQRALDWINGNEDLVNGPNATGAAFLVPQAQGDGDVGLIHDELLKMHLRERRTPKDFMDAIYIASGNRHASALLERHKQWQDQYEAAGDKTMLKAENDRWSKTVQELGLANPLWWDNYQSQDRSHVADRAYRDLLQIFAGPKGQEVLNTEQGKLVGALVLRYQDHLQTVASIGNRRTAAQVQARNAENQRWDDFLTNLSKNEPRLTSVVQSVFSRLDATLDV